MLSLGVVIIPRERSIASPPRLPLDMFDHQQGFALNVLSLSNHHLEFYRSNVLEIKCARQSTMHGPNISKRIKVLRGPGKIQIE